MSPKPSFAPLIVAFAEEAQAKRVELDEASRVFLVVGAGVVLEGHDLVRVERFRRRAPNDDDIAFVELEPDLALDMLLALIDQRLKHLALWREPEAVIDELGVARHQRILEMHGLAVEGERLDRSVRDVENGAAGSFVDAARLHADEPVLDEIDAADAVLLAIGVELGEERGRRQPRTIDRHRIASLEADGDLDSFVWGFLWRQRALIDVRRRLLCRILEHLPFGRGMQKVC